MKMFFQKILDQPRLFFGYLSVVCFGLLGVGFFLEYFVGLIPCQLCILQRIFFFLVGVTGAIAFFAVSRKESFLASGVFASVFSFLGFLIALRHVYIQWVPQVVGTTCAPPWLSSFSDVVTALTSASANCAERGFTIFFLSIPEWALLSFAFLLFSSLFFIFSGIFRGDTPSGDIDRI